MQNTWLTFLLELQDYAAYHEHNAPYTELNLHISQYDSDAAIALVFDYLRHGTARHGASECGNCVMDS